MKFFLRQFQFLIGWLQTQLQFLFLCSTYSSFNSSQVGYKLFRFFCPNYNFCVSIPHRLATNWSYRISISRLLQVSIPHRLATNFSKYCLTFTYPFGFQFLIGWLQTIDTMLKLKKKQKRFNSSQVGYKPSNKCWASQPVRGFNSSQVGYKL